MIVFIPGGSALGRHSGVSHYSDSIIADSDSELMTGDRTFVDVKLISKIVGDPSSICPTSFALRGQDM